MKTILHPEVYVRDGRGGFILRDGAEIVDEWQGGCLVRSEDRLPTGPAETCYVIEGEVLVALRLPADPTGHGPFDYAAEKDRSDMRLIPVF